VRAVGLAVRGRLNVLAGTGEFRVFWIVAGHVARTAPARRVEAGLQSRGYEVGRLGMGAGQVAADVACADGLIVMETKVW
jgi:hypothetical protein